MAENEPKENNLPSTPKTPSRPPERPLTPPEPGPEPAPHQPAPGNASSPAKPAVRLDDVPKPYAARQARPASTWIMIAIISLLVMILVFVGIRSRRTTNPGDPAADASSVQENADLSHYTAFVAKNRALLERESSEISLSDEEFAGQAPLATRANGPLVSREIDPQLAALVDAFRVRVQVMQGSYSLARNQAPNRVTKGEIRGFKVLALEKIENGRIVFEEAQITTPRNGLIKTSGRVLQVLQKTDLPGVMAEIKAAGMEFSPLLPPAGGMQIRGQLRISGPWGKALPREQLISGNGVGGLTLGVPVAQIKKSLPATYSVLKRKVPVKDSFYDVVKIMDQVGEPLFYVYERDGRVWGISIIGESFKTRQGIGINNTLDQIRLHYPLVKLAYSEKKTPFVRVDGVDGIFIIQGAGDKKVISILIGESPEFE